MLRCWLKTVPHVHLLIYDNNYKSSTASNLVQDLVSISLRENSANDNLSWPFNTGN